MSDRDFTKEEPVATSFASAPSRPAASLVQTLGLDLGVWSPTQESTPIGQYNCLVLVVNCCSWKLS